ncbi:MAG: tetratricopeptide repeat protein [Myxococcota bacterium]
MNETLSNKEDHAESQNQDAATSASKQDAPAVSEPKANDERSKTESKEETSSRDSSGITRTAGQRFAAAKAAKASRKAAQRGRQAEDREQEVLQRASRATQWLRDRGTYFSVGLSVILALLAGVTFWASYTEGQTSQAGSELWSATQTARARVDRESDPALLDSRSSNSDAEVYTSRVERSEKALGRFRKVTRDFAGSEAASWAALGEGAALLEVDRGEDARKAFETALSASNDDAVHWRALEGIAFSFEADEAWDQATARLSELKQLGSGVYEHVANLHIARIELARGREEQAKELLQELYERLKDESTLKSPDMLRRVERSLRELDSALVTPAATTPLSIGSHGAVGATSTQGPSQAEIQELIRRLSKEQQSGGTNTAAEGVDKHRSPPDTRQDESPSE